jgi:hypothetical protein
MKPQKRYFLIICLAALCVSAHAQLSSVIVFAPKGEKFTLFFGSKSKNAEPAARVEADNPGGPSFKIKVVFADPSVKEISKMVFNKPGSAMYFKVEKNAKGAFTIESASSEWMAEENSIGTDKPAPPPSESSAQAKNEPKSNETAKSGNSNSTNSKGCENPLSDQDFTPQLLDISARPFEPMQLSAAKKMAETRCLRVSQVVLVIHVFDSESSRLSFAKFAYDHTFDRENYSDVKDALHSSKSKDDLDRFISEKSK